MAEKKDKGKNNNAKNKKKKFKPQRKFRINKKLDGNTGIIFIGHEDPFLYFPDMMSYLSRDEIENIHLKARGKSISNAVNVAEQFKNRFGKEIKSRIDNVEIGTEEVPRKDKKGKIKMSFIDITMSRTEVED
jgi:DNA-binding protein